MTWLMLMMILVFSCNVGARPVVESPRGPVVALQLLLGKVLVPHNQNAQNKLGRCDSYQSPTH